MLRGVQGVWKMPTGLVNAREDVSEAAVREVLEVRSFFIMNLQESAAVHVTRVIRQWARDAVTACSRLLYLMITSEPSMRL